MRKRLCRGHLYQETGDAGILCRRCVISYPTLRKRKLGARRIRHELRRHHEPSLSLNFSHKVLVTSHMPPPVRPLRRETRYRYARLTPGDRVQLDPCKIALGCYQYTAVGDSLRYRVLAMFPRRTAANTLLFLERLIEEIPFPVQPVQTDRGRKFFAVAVQPWLMHYCISLSAYPSRHSKNETPPGRRKFGVYLAFQHTRFTRKFCYQKLPWAFTPHFHLFHLHKSGSYFLWHCLFH